MGGVVGEAEESIDSGALSKSVRLRRSDFRFTQALDWDRGRLARTERTAKRRSEVEHFLEILAPGGGWCGRAARGPSEELEWSRMENSRNIFIFDSHEQLAEAAAERFVNSAQEAITQQGRFSVALAGGNTPKRVYELLASERFKGRVEWPKVHLFFGDERCVPPDHPDSNYRMANEALITHVPIPPANVHRMAGEGEPSVSALLYETEMRQFVGNVTWPSFDLVLLGLGKDGHTASLFPQTKALTEQGMWVVANWVESLGVHRLTMTAPVLNHGRRIIFLVTGSDKAKALKEVLMGPRDPLRLPAQLIDPSEGTCEWLVDRDAAKLLS